MISRNFTFVVALNLLGLGAFPTAHQKVAAKTAVDADLVVNKVDASTGPVAVHAARRGNPWINLADGRVLFSLAAGDLSRQPASAVRQVVPLALAAGDFDGDGVPDLLCGYGGPSGGLLSLRRGNIDAIYPETPEARRRKAEGRFDDSPFISPGAEFRVPVSPVFMGAGDFDADGRLDVVSADAEGNRLYWLKGDGNGRFAEPAAIELPGAVSAVVTGEVNGMDGLADLVVGVEGPAGAQALIYQSSRGALNCVPQTLAAPSRINAVALGQIDDDYPFDLVIAAGR
jgi:hypothetical protein